MPSLSFISKMFNTSPRDDVNLEENEDAAAAVAASQLPSKPTSKYDRNRSLSKVFGLPSHLPSAMDVQYDVLEFWLHVSILEQDAQKARGYETTLTSLAQELQPRNYGRLYTRLQIALLWQDVCGILSKEQSNDDNVWSMVNEQWIACRGFCVRKDANVYVPTYAQVPQDSQDAATLPPCDATPDPTIEQHDMMGAQYDECRTLIQVQSSLTELSLELSNLRRGRWFTKDCRNALDAYHERLVELFDENIPDDLESFVIHDLYKAKKDNDSMVTNMRRDITALQQSTNSPYGYAVLHQKMRTLLLKWTESLLEIPVFVQHQLYGLVSLDVGNEDDDISAMEEDNVEQQKPTATPTPQEEETRQQLRQLQKPPGKSPRRQTQDEEEEPLQTQAPAPDQDDFAMADDDDDDDHAALIAAIDAVCATFAKSGSFHIKRVYETLRAEPYNLTVDKDTKKIVRNRLQELFNLESPEKKKADEEEEENVVNSSSKKKRDQDKHPALMPKALRQATEEVFDTIEDLDGMSQRGFMALLEKEYEIELDKAAKEIVYHHLEKLINAREGKPEITKIESSEEEEEEEEEKAATPRKRSASKKRKGDGRFQAIEWVDSDSESEVLWADSSSPPSKKKRRKGTINRTRAGHQVPTKRGPFSEEELEALREGVSRGLVGKWGQMREICGGVLAERTGVQIKDKYRNLVRTNQI